MMRVGRHENIFILFLMAIKTAGSAQKVRFCRVSGNSYFLRPTSYRIISKKIFIMERSQSEIRQITKNAQLRHDLMLL